MKEKRKIDPMTGQPYGPDYTPDGRISLHGSLAAPFVPYADRYHPSSSDWDKAPNNVQVSITEKVTKTKK